MRVVLDTNIVVSSTLVSKGNAARIMRAWHAGDFELVLSPATLEEMGRVLTYDKIRKYHK